MCTCQRLLLLCQLLALVDVGIVVSRLMGSCLYRSCN
jgi:hypothetical protein